MLCSFTVTAATNFFFIMYFYIVVPACVCMGPVCVCVHVCVRVCVCLCHFVGVCLPADKVVSVPHFPGYRCYLSDCLATELCCLVMAKLVV